MAVFAVGKWFWSQMVCGIFVKKHTSELVSVVYIHIQLPPFLQGGGDD